MLKLTVIGFSVALASSAFAQPKAAAPAAEPAKQMPVGPKAPMPVDSKPNPDAMPPKPPEASPEITAMAKGMAGTWKCTGKGDFRGTTYDLKATITHKVEATLNKFWIESNFVGTFGKNPPMKFKSFTGYDAASKKMFRVNINGSGGHGTAVGTITDRKVTYEGDMVGPMGTIRMRQSEEMVSPKEAHIVGEISKDSGKTWVADHDATCKK